MTSGSARARHSKSSGRHGAVNLCTAPWLTSPALAALGVGGIGFAFAAQKHLGEFVWIGDGGLDRPFSVGDWVQIGWRGWTVEELVSGRRFRLPTNPWSIPNAKLTTAIVDNYGERNYRRFKATLARATKQAPNKWKFLQWGESLV